MRLGQSHGRVRAAGIDHDDLAGNALYALQRADDVGLFIQGDDANRACHGRKDIRRKACGNRVISAVTSSWPVLRIASALSWPRCVPALTRFLFCPRDSS